MADFTLNKLATPLSTDTLVMAQSANSSMIKMQGAKPLTMDKINEVAQDFEAQFISQMMSTMFPTIDTENSFGGSEAEDTYRSFMIQEYGKIVARTGGIGIASQVKESMLKLQEVKSHASATPAA